MAAALPWAAPSAVPGSALLSAAPGPGQPHRALRKGARHILMALRQAPLQNTRLSPAEKIEPPPGITQGTNTQPSGSLRGVEGLPFYLLSGKHNSSIEHTKTIYCFRGLWKKDENEGEAQGLSSDVEKVSRKYTAWDKLSPNSCKNPNLQHPPPSSPPGRVPILIKHTRSWRNVFII